MASTVMETPDVKQTSDPGMRFGHPRGLSTLYFTEVWERFSYYGMRALLVLFMTAAATGANPGLGFNVRNSTAIYGLYTSMVYLLALPGGWVADKLWGQQPRAHDDEEQPCEEGRHDGQADQGGSEGEVPEGDDASADEDCALLTPQLVGDPSAWQGEQVDHRGVEAVDGGRVADVEPEAGIRAGGGGGHEEHEQSPHAVVAEPLPHFREEERR